MTADNGYIKCRFSGTSETMEGFRTLVERTDRANQFSCGLSWLDDLDCFDEAESESISYDSISATQEFLQELLQILPDLQFEGVLEHSWPILPYRHTIVEFSAENGTLCWNEQEEELELDLPFPYETQEEDDKNEEIVIPLTPYD